MDNSFICAGGIQEVDTCTVGYINNFSLSRKINWSFCFNDFLTENILQGDGGSPLVCPIKNDPLRYIQVGIVSWGIGCGTNDVPGVYANVAKAKRWIDDTLKSYNLDTKVYNPPLNDGIPRVSEWNALTKTCNSRNVIYGQILLKNLLWSL